jgi:ankyrin repeat protein
MTTQPTESQLEIFRRSYDFEAMKQIIEATNVDVNYDRVLIWAACNGHNKIVQLLIAAGADVNIVDWVIININIIC